MHRLGLGRLLEAPVQLVVEGARAVHRRHVLRDAGEIQRPVGRVAERGRELPGELGATVEPEDRDDASGDERLDDLCVRVAFSVPVRRAATGCLAAEDGALQTTKALAGLDAELVERVAGGRVCVERLRRPPRALECAHQEEPEALS